MKVLLVDDEPEFVKILTVAFQVYRPGFSLVSAATGAQALAAIKEASPDVVVLDVMLPDIDGLEVCRRLRTRSETPIILLTARDREEDVLRGFEAGADDYVTKPCSYRTLMARIEAVTRRKLGQGSDGPGVLSFGGLTVDLAQRQVQLHGQVVDLTPKEYRILEELARSSGQMVSHESLLISIWGEDYRDEPQYLKTYIYRLRQKIEEDPHRPHYILTHYGGGYCLAHGEDGGAGSSRNEVNVESLERTESK